MTEQKQSIEQLIDYIHSAVHADVNGSHAEDLRLAAMQFRHLIKEFTNSGRCERHPAVGELSYWLVRKPEHADQFWSYVKPHAEQDPVRQMMAQEFDEWLSDILAMWKRAGEPEPACRLKLHSFASLN